MDQELGSCQLRYSFGAGEKRVKEPYLSFFASGTRAVTNGFTMYVGNDGASKFVTQVSVGLMHTCVILSDGNIKCWGQNQFGQLGLGDTKNRGNHLTGLWPKDQQIRCNNPYFKERVSCSKELNQITVKLGEYVPVSGDSADNKAVQAKQVGHSSRVYMQIIYIDGVRFDHWPTNPMMRRWRVGTTTHVRWFTTHLLWAP